MIVLMTHTTTRWTAFSQKRINISSTQRLQIFSRSKVTRWCFFFMLRKGKLNLSYLKIKRPCLYLMFSKAKSTIKLLNLSRRILLIVHVLNNMTDQFQPLDLNVNGHAKKLLKVEFEV